jgi:hypothetical protein
VKSGNLATTMETEESSVGIQLYQGIHCPRLKSFKLCGGDSNFLIIAIFRILKLKDLVYA